MKKIAFSVGLVAAGAASLQIATAQGMNSMQAFKDWSLSGTLRGFYDDNYTTAPDGPDKRGSGGFQFSPAFSLNVPLSQTQFGLQYIYGLYYYQDREDHGGRPIDQTHQANLWVNHSFTQAWQASAQDSFVYAQEPDLAKDSGFALRTSGSYLRNNGSVKVDTQWTDLLGSEIGYQNTLYYYEAHPKGAVSATPDYDGLLSRMEHLAWLQASWQALPDVKALIGYQYGQVNYTADHLLAPAYKFRSDSRDSRSHYGYLGVEYNPWDNLTVALKGGIQYVDFYNAPAGQSDSTVSPYVDLSGTYTYLPGSYVQIGFTQERNASAVAGSTLGGGEVLDEESSTVYGSVNHQFTTQLVGSLIGRVQNSDMHGGAFDGQTETWYSAGINLSYSFTQHLSAEIGYNFDKLDSSAALTAAGQSYTRNRAYVGITAVY
ncbi:MAG: outer membrane beta-barrel protein [Verrucomicrobiota bacterium]|nr:outer membrane beta-barrel protein [Verrucomicrobiota bacterium]